MVMRTILVGLHLESARLLVDGMLRPISDWELEDPFMNINESGFLDSLSHQIRNVHAVSGLGDYRLHSSMEVCKMRVFWHGAIIAQQRSSSLRGVSDVLRPNRKDSYVDVLYPSARSEIVIGSLVKLLPFYRRTNTIHETKMNEVKFVGPRPRLNLMLEVV